MEVPTPRAAQRAFSVRRVARFIAANLAILLLLLALLEGVASLALLGRDLSSTRLPAERRHTRHDPELGWVNRANLAVPDMYGPGIALHTNAQGFRNVREFTPAVPAGTLRAICSGDSFTLGYGVADEDTWCALLAAKTPTLETVNMGQGGYGVDQAYLWYKRDGAALDHDLHLFAVVSSDFQRMQRSDFMGYPKPSLDLVDGTIKVTNLPLAERPPWAPWLGPIRSHVSRLRIAQLVERVRAGISQRETRENLVVREMREGDEDRDAREYKTEEIARAIFEDLRRMNDRKGSRLVLIHLPTQRLLGAADRWRDFLAGVARDLGVGWVDVTAVFTALETEDPTNLFIPEGALDYPGAAFHLNERGNELAARVIGAAIAHELAWSSHGVDLPDAAITP